MIIRFYRTGGLPPPDHEMLVTVDDGRTAVWRSTNVPVAGSFVATLSPAEESELQALAARSLEAGDLRTPLRPDAALDSIELEGAQAMAGHLDTPEGPWGELFGRLRVLLDRLTDEPYQAVAVEVDPARPSARLVHRGSAPLDLDLSDAAVTASRLGPAGEVLSSGMSVVEGAERVTATPGWSIELPLPPAIDATRDGQVAVSASLVAYEGDNPVPVTVRARG